MKTYVDLSVQIHDNMPVHPYDEKVRLYEDKILQKDKFTNSRLETGMHAGTHIDAPRHFLETDTYISDFSLEQFAGNGCLLDVRGEEVITFKEDYEEKVKEGDIVLLLTGFASKYKGEQYYKNFDKHPVVDTKLADFFCKKNIKLLGMDMPKPDNFPFDIHKQLLINNVLILENLVNLEKLTDIPQFEFFAFPLKIQAEGSIVRQWQGIKINISSFDSSTSAFDI